MDLFEEVFEDIGVEEDVLLGELIKGIFWDEIIFIIMGDD